MEIVSGVFAIIGVVIGSFLSYHLQTRLQDRKRKAQIDNTRIRFINSLQVTQQLFDLADRTGGWPIQGKEPFTRLIALGFSDALAALIVELNTLAFYPTMAQLETATASMWYSFEAIRVEQDKSAAVLSNPDRAALVARIDDCRKGARAAARHGHALCISIRSMLGDDVAISKIEVLDAAI